MVRSVEKILKSGIERCRLENFDYGDFLPENAFPIQTDKPKSQKRSRWQGNDRRSGSNNTASPSKQDNRQSKPPGKITGNTGPFTISKSKPYSGKRRRNDS